MVYCCVVNCNRNSNTNPDGDNVKFFRFPAKNQEQRELWVKAVKRIDIKGRPWQPTKYSRICSLHFIDGTTNPTR